MRVRAESVNGPMKVEAVDCFYFALPQIADIADGSQDSFIVRIRSDTGLEGYGESDSSPVVAFACYCTPPSHCNIVNLRECLVGQSLENPGDVIRIYHQARRRCLDLAHFPHAYSGGDIALWDLLGQRLQEPVYRLLGFKEALSKQAYASLLFGDTPDATRLLARSAIQSGFKAAKFGWGPFGGSESLDIQLVKAAREGLGKQSALMVDAGTAWGEDWRTALQRAQRLAPYQLTWLEEPLSPDAVVACGELTQRSAVPIAAGEGCRSLRSVKDLLQTGQVRFLQIDPGRLGGITPSFEALKVAQEAGAVFVNHTFKSHLSLAAACTCSPAILLPSGWSIANPDRPCCGPW